MKLANLPLFLIPTKNMLAENTFSYLRKYLSKSDNVLDVGTGNGLVAELIRKKIGAKVTGIDVIDANLTKSKTIIFDGQNIPFKENIFTVSLCCFVLHHAYNPEALLREIKRVTSSIIIIFEDVPQTFFDRILELVHKLSSAIWYRSSQVLLKNDSQWKKIFKDLDFTLIKAEVVKKRRDPLYPVSRQMYVLKK